MLGKIVAWRVMSLTILGRECPELPCEIMFTADEWKPVWKITREQEPLPATAPDLGTFLRMLADAGGCWASWAAIMAAATTVPRARGRCGSASAA